VPVNLGMSMQNFEEHAAGQEGQSAVPEPLNRGGPSEVRRASQVCRQSSPRMARIRSAPGAMLCSP
jgi:hypothetical protein